MIDILCGLRQHEAMPTTSFWEHPIAKLEEALNIRKQIAALESKLRSIFGGDGDEPAKVPAGSKRTGKRSPAVRAKMAAAQKARWAKKAQVATPVEVAAPQAAARAAKKKGGISAAGRAAIIAAQKARWAKIKSAKAAPVTPAPKAKKAKRNISPEAKARMVEAVKRRWAKQKAAKIPTAKG
jgi:hypothetical protein